MQRWQGFSRDSAGHILTILVTTQRSTNRRKRRRGREELGETAALFAAHSELSGYNREITNKIDLKSEKRR